MAVSAVGGALGCQASLAVTNVLNGDDPGEGLWQAKDLLKDGLIGGITAGICWGLGNIGGAAVLVRIHLLKPLPVQSRLALNT